MERKRRILMVIVFGLMSVVLLGLLPRGLDAETITLRYASYNPPRGMGAQTSMWMMAEITKRTKGKVKFQQYFGGSLLKSRETLRGVQMGTADMGYIFVPYFPKELRLWSVAEPFVRGPVHPEKKGLLLLGSLRTVSGAEGPTGEMESEAGRHTRLR